MQKVFAAHLRHVALLYSVDRHARVVLIVDNAPWHWGKLIDGAPAEHEQLISTGCRAPA